MTPTFPRAFFLALLTTSTLSLGCSSSSSSHGTGPADASTADSTSPSDAQSEALADARPTDDVPAIDATGIVAARPYTLHVPSGYKAGTPTPVLFMFHGFGISGDVEEAYMQLQGVSDAHGFLYVYSTGTLSKPTDGGLGSTFWNATNACCDFYDSGVDDVQYFDAMLDDLQSKYSVDPKRVFVVGHSNGGFMSHRLACDRASRVAAIVSLEGAQWLDLSKCNPSAPVSVVEVHGDADQTIYFDGGSTQSAAYPGALATMGDWGSRNGCTGALAATGQTLDLVADLPGSETAVEAYAGCPPGIDAQLWLVHGGVHIPTLTQPGWGETVWTFLSAHPRP
ncbi:MAG TPA: hypothetical protein VIF09_19840 [Polyangiaceae bacterium]